jgi:hypothetical protein
MYHLPEIRIVGLRCAICETEGPWRRNLMICWRQQRTLALAEAEEASKQARQAAEAEAEKQAFLERLVKPSGVSDEEAIRRGIKLIERAVANGKTEVQVHRFPNQLCTDKGRAIIQQEVGWESTLTGVPKEIYQLWAKYFRPRGYKLRVEIIDYPGGLPGDVGMTLMWS